jgi:membrane protein YqaA with SNARE-associated domain
MADSPEISASRAASYRSAALVSTAVFAALCGALVLYDPRYTQLAIYGLYAIPAHLLISFLPHEPALWIAARLYPAIVVAVVGTAATVVAIVLDYWLIGWLVNHHLVKPVVQESRWFTFASRWFRKAPALLIVGSALTPGVPFYPVKIMAIAADYPLRRFIVALIVGRLPRFYVLARFLAALDNYAAPKNSTLMYIVLALAAFGAWRFWKARKQVTARK